LDRRRHPSRRTRGIGAAVAVSLVFHLLFFVGLARVWPSLKHTPSTEQNVPVKLVVEVVPPETPETEPETPRPDGQLVDTPEPDEKERPEDADHLAEHDRTVEEEMRDPRYRINPEVLAEQFHEDDELQFEEAIDLNVDEPSTGAQVGNDRFDPDRDGRLAALPSPYRLTNLDGLQKPVPASSRASQRAGAPNNDLLDVAIGNRTQLNTRELVGADYINRIRRLVNYFWDQNLQNLPRSVILTRSSYTTVVDVVLDNHGALQRIEVTVECGSQPLDQAVVDAFRIAGPFPNPPPQLIEKDGRVYLSKMGFTVPVGRSRPTYEGVDPRAGVRFPGLLNSPQ